MKDRAGLDRLLAARPRVAVSKIERNDYWLCVDLDPNGGYIEKYAIWLTTGEIYRVAADGSVGTDQVFEAI